MTNQEIFDLVWKTYVTEQKPAMIKDENDDWYCVYSNKDGSHGCAIGICALTRGADPKILMDTNASINIKDSDTDYILELIDNDDIDFLVGIQRCHNSSAIYFDEGQELTLPNENFNLNIEIKLIQLSKEFRLEVPND